MPLDAMVALALVHHTSKSRTLAWLKTTNNTLTTMITQSAILAITGLVLFGITNAYADHAWYVSAESEMFENHFVGAQVIEVIVHGGSLNIPIVTVGDNPLPMFQAISGNWYGYFVELNKAMEAQDLGLFMFGEYESTCVLPDSITDCEPEDDYGMFAYVEDGRTVLDEPPKYDIPIYAFQFTEGSDIDVELENGANTETVTLSYDTVEDYAGLMLDRGAYPQSAHVHLEVTDAWLNIDPTSEDDWYFNTVGDYSASYRGTDNYVVLQDTGLMCDDNCVLMIDPDRQGTNENGVLKVVSNMDHALTEHEIEHYTIRLEESSPNSGVFTNSDDNDDANLMITDDARGGTTATIDYNDSPIDIAVNTQTLTADNILEHETTVEFIKVVRTILLDIPAEDRLEVLFDIVTSIFSELRSTIRLN